MFTSLYISQNFLPDVTNRYDSVCSYFILQSFDHIWSKSILTATPEHSLSHTHTHARARAHTHTHTHNSDTHTLLIFIDIRHVYTHSHTDLQNTHIHICSYTGAHTLIHRYTHILTHEAVRKYENFREL